MNNARSMPVGEKLSELEIATNARIIRAFVAKISYFFACAASHSMSVAGFPLSKTSEPSYSVWA